MDGEFHQDCPPPTRQARPRRAGVMDYAFLALLNHDSLNPRGRAGCDPAPAPRPPAEPPRCAEEADDA
ncbi:hypothetical protein [Nonomuraea sp. LPB2021202275-12-8]|uniref:hypothetical protein n=1 Tax=Nonomuraea sp. LPB2021202275-12-8 TaxID=3120159 RepID=UPI00300CFD7B